MIIEGNAKALKRNAQGVEEEVMAYEPGQYFGERALLTSDLRAASIVATTPVKCLTLDQSTFRRLLGPLDEILKRNMEAYNKFK